MKKLLVGAFLWMFTLAGITLLPNYVSAQEYWGGGGWWEWTEGSSKVGWFGEGKASWFGQQQMGYNPSTPWSDGLKSDSLIYTIRTAINWVLWILSLIALVLCLYAGFLMMTSGWDSKKYEKGVWILKWAWIGLAIIALSWLIVSLIFYIIGGSIGNDKLTGQNTSVGEIDPAW